jgi:phosphohistidine swiveling domain-containing protein
MIESKDLIDINEASKLLGVSKLTLRNWDKSGLFKAVRIGNRGDRRYKKVDIEKFISKNSKIESNKEINKTDFLNFLKNNTFWMEEIPGLPIPLEMGVKKMVEFHTRFNPALSYCIFFYENDYIKQALSIEESIKNCEVQFETLHKEPEKIEKFVSDCVGAFSKMDRVITRTNFLDLKTFSDEKLLKEFTEFHKSLGEFWDVTLAVEPYSPFFDHVFVPRFEKEIGDVKKARQAFATLALPTELSFVSQERRDILRIVLKYLSQSKEQKILESYSNADYLTRIKYEMPDFSRALHEHQQNYFWIQNSYGLWNILTVNHFLDFIREIVKNTPIADLKEDLNSLENQNPLKQEQARLMKDLNVSADLQKELEYVQKVVWIKDERKRSVLMMLHCVFTFLDEFAKRTNIDFRLLSYARIDEYAQIIKKEFNLDILSERRDQSFYVSEKGGGYSILTSNDAVMVRDLLFHEHNNPKTDTDQAIQGSIACRGKQANVIGKVKVILDPKDKTIESDEILVTSMTRPEFVPLMRKALGVITDEGGITCHAAIVSREMNKPCIIGSKFATKVLKTGDEIEMKMNHGSIKVVKRSSL